MNIPTVGRASTGNARRAMETNEPILQAENIHRTFTTADATLYVLKGLSLRVASGQMIAVTGASGVGKSTLLHILGGLDRPTEGTVRLSGIDLGSQTEKQLARFRNQRVGFVFQFHYLLQDFTALENVMIPLLVAGATRAEASTKAERIMDLVSLRDRQSHRPTELSGGEQQRVAVARALANSPELVLADEPSGNLDTETGRKLHDLLFHLNRDKGITFLIATHNRELAEGCDTELTIADGRLKAVGQETG